MFSSANQLWFLWAIHPFQLGFSSFKLAKRVFYPHPTPPGIDILEWTDMPFWLLQVPMWVYGCMCARVSRSANYNDEGTTPRVLLTSSLARRIFGNGCTFDFTVCTNRSAVHLIRPPSNVSMQPDRVLCFFFCQGLNRFSPPILVPPSRNHSVLHRNENCSLFNVSVHLPSPAFIMCFLWKLESLWNKVELCTTMSPLSVLWCHITEISLPCLKELRSFFVSVWYIGISLFLSLSAGFSNLSKVLLLEMGFLDSSTVFYFKKVKVKPLSLLTLWVLSEY